MLILYKKKIFTQKQYEFTKCTKNEKPFQKPFQIQINV
jgi:hypothetical protein